MIINYFTDIQNKVFELIGTAHKSLKIAMAWIDLEIYKNCFIELLERGVKIKILMDSNPFNRNQKYNIESLIDKGAEIRLVYCGGIMHHKFCIIDNSICMFGSYNWTKAANTRNIENLNACDDVKVVNCFRYEFKALWELSNTDIRLLQNPEKCECCNNPMINIMLMEQEGEFQTKLTVLKRCSVCENNSKMTNSEYYDINVLNNYIGCLQEYNDEIDRISQYNDASFETYINELKIRRDFMVSTYLSNVRHNRMSVSIIHAVAVKDWEWITKDDGEYVYRVIWKERGRVYWR